MKLLDIIDNWLSGWPGKELTLDKYKTAFEVQAEALGALAGRPADIGGIPTGYSPNPLQAPTATNQPLPVNISKAANGVIINIGCKTFVSTDMERAFRAIMEYFIDPEAAKRKYLK